MAHFTFSTVRLLSAAALVTTTASALAQSSGAVSGTLRDQQTQEALPFANVALLHLPDSAQVQGGLTDENGRFQLLKVAPGTYLLRASALGYGTVRRPLTLTAGQPELALGTVGLRAVTQQLQGVTVTGERAVVQDDLDKKVINVEKDLGSVGGTAVNVLQNVPSVTVAPDGTVSLRGSSNLTILIDGKPSPAGGGNQLEQIPASSIEKVEVVTNPSARYAAAGGGGVINIVLKKQKKDGWNGQATATVGTRDKYNGSLSLNRRVGKLNVFGAADVRDMEFRSSMYNDQYTTFEGRRLRTYQQGNNTRQNRTYGGRVGFDVELPASQSLTVALRPNFNRSSNGGTQQATLTDDAGTRRLDSSFGVRENVDNINTSADYRRTWKQHKGRELTANLSHTYLNANVVVSQRNLAGSDTDDLREWKQDLHVGMNAVSGQLDYVHPLGEKARLSTGLYGQWQSNHGTDNFLRQQADYQAFERLADRSFTYDFREHIQAAYGQVQQQVGKWNVQGGLRAEYTHMRGAVHGGQGAFGLDYLNLFPSATVARPLPKAEQRVQFSYSRRLNRPDFMQLLAFPLYQDQRSYRIGDPTLRPEFVHTLELGHQITLGTGNLSSTLFYRQTNNAIQRLTAVDTVATRLYGNGAVITARYNENFGQALSYGAEATWSQPLTKWWRLMATGSLYETNVTAATGNETSRRTVSGTARLMNTFTPTPKLDVQLSGNYRAAAVTVQGRVAPVGSVDVALRQRLFNDRAALTLRVSDLFNNQRQLSTAYAPNFSAKSYNKWESRVGYLGFSWYLGSTKPPKKIDNQPQGGGGGFGG